MGYLIYLIGFVICIIHGISLHNICNFIDAISFGFVIVPCILVLITTGYWRGFIKAFVYIFDKKRENKEGVRESAKAVKLTCLSSLIFGGLGVMISLINALHNLNLEASYVAADVSVALISIFYALMINSILLPLYFELKRRDTKSKSR